MPILIYPVKKRREILYKASLVIFIFLVLIFWGSFFLSKKHPTFLEIKKKEGLLKEGEINQIRETLHLFKDKHFLELKESFPLENLSVDKLPPETKGKKDIFSPLP